MPVSSSSIFMHTRFFDLAGQRVQNLRNCFIEALLNSFFFSTVFSSVEFLACFYALLWAASFLVASCSSDVSTSSAGS